ncbi:hypothetical protein NUW54_g13770 [Trametes sanguinea]|uniref:Uncharacterized protein n=1 Tax=Trametes sanguinea TaxID=158606 RepID=A0ACC1MIU2_9APHY|nr:hypothetical protein NUW54_g13770 [Trametes sanguinea]
MPYTVREKFACRQRSARAITLPRSPLPEPSIVDDAGFHSTWLRSLCSGHRHRQVAGASRRGKLCPQTTTTAVPSLSDRACGPCMYVPRRLALTAPAPSPTAASLDTFPLLERRPAFRCSGAPKRQLLVRRLKSFVVQLFIGKASLP